MDKNNSPVLITSQGWKLWLFGALLAVAGLGSLFIDGIGHLLGVSPFLVQMGTLLLTFGTLGASILSVRCSHCGLRLVMHAMSSQGVGQWLSWLLTVKSCPQCGQSARQEDNDTSRSQGQ